MALCEEGTECSISHLNYLVDDLYASRIVRFMSDIAEYVKLVDAKLRSKSTSFNATCISALSTCSRDCPCFAPSREAAFRRSAAVTHQQVRER